MMTLTTRTYPSAANSTIASASWVFSFTLLLINSDNISLFGFDLEGGSAHLQVYSSSFSST